jgi:hypothetical protein
VIPPSVSPLVVNSLFYHINLMLWTRYILEKKKTRLKLIKGATSLLSKKAFEHVIPLYFRVIKFLNFTQLYRVI